MYIPLHLWVIISVEVGVVIVEVGDTVIILLETTSETREYLVEAKLIYI